MRILHVEETTPRYQVVVVFFPCLCHGGIKRYTSMLMSTYAEGLCCRDTNEIPDDYFEGKP